MYFGMIFLYALGRGKEIIDSIDQIQYLEPDHKWSSRILFTVGDLIEMLNPITNEIDIIYKSYKKFKFLFDKIGKTSIPSKPSSGINGDWSIAYLKQIDRGLELGPLILKRFRKWSNNHNTDMIGPFSILKAYEKYPTFAEKLFKPGVFDINGNWLNSVPDSELRVPSIWQGDQSAEQLAKYDYNPTQEECDDDNAEIDLNEIFGTPVIEEL
jgi:hypothetical protein